MLRHFKRVLTQGTKNRSLHAWKMPSCNEMRNTVKKKEREEDGSLPCSYLRNIPVRTLELFPKLASVSRSWEKKTSIKTKDQHQATRLFSKCSGKQSFSFMIENPIHKKCTEIHFWHRYSLWNFSDVEKYMWWIIPGALSWILELDIKANVSKADKVWYVSVINNFSNLWMCKVLGI